MPLTNPDFEIQGSHPGEAQGWALSTYVAKERIAGFGPAPYLGFEDFERWCEFKYRFDGTDLVICFFNTETTGFESFDTAWDNTIYLWDLPTGHVITAIFGSNTYEDMATGWTFGPYERQFDAVSSTQAMLNDAGTEDFESRWSENEMYIRDFDLVPQDKAMFDAGLFDVEHFVIDVWPTDEEEEEQSHG